MLLAVEISLARVVQIQISQTTEPNQSESSPRPNNLRMMICKKPTEPVLPNIRIAAAPPKLDTHSRPDGDDDGDGGHGDHVDGDEQVLEQPVHALAVHLGQASEPEERE